MPPSVYEPGTGGLWRSDDSGENWRPVASRGIKGNILVLAVSPNDAEAVFAAGYRSLWKSLDGGRRWVEIPAPRGVSRITELLALPSGTLLAGDGWRIVPGTGTRRLEAGFARRGRRPRVELLQRSGEKDIAVVTSAGAFVGEDTENGRRACGALPENAAWYGLAVDPTGDRVALGATSKGLFRSTDGCASWSPVRSGLDGGTVSPCSISPHRAGSGPRFAGRRPCSIHR